MKLYAKENWIAKLSNLLTFILLLHRMKAFLQKELSAQTIVMQLFLCNYFKSDLLVFCLDKRHSDVPVYFLTLKRVLQLWFTTCSPTLSLKYNPENVYGWKHDYNLSQINILR